MPALTPRKLPSLSHPPNSQDLEAGHLAPIANTTASTRSLPMRKPFSWLPQMRFLGDVFTGEVALAGDATWTIITPSK